MPNLFLLLVIFFKLSCLALLTILWERYASFPTPCIYHGLPKHNRKGGGGGGGEEDKGLGSTAHNHLFRSGTNEEFHLSGNIIKAPKTLR